MSDKSHSRRASTLPTKILPFLDNPPQLPELGDIVHAKVSRMPPAVADAYMQKVLSAVFEDDEADTVAYLQAQLQSIKVKPRFQERDDEIVRLRDEMLPDGKRRTFGQVCQIIEKKWPTTQTGTPLTAAAVGAAYKRRKSKRN